MAKALANTGDDVAAQVVKMLKAHKVAKAEGDDGQNAPPPDVDTIVHRIDLSSLSAIADAVSEDLFDLASDTTMKALAQVGVSAADAAKYDLVNQVNEAALAFAKERAAELVGKRWTANGTLIDNPNAKWAITQTTRDMLRQTIADGIEQNLGIPAMGDAIQEAYAFSPARSQIIAQTEVANANEQAKLQGWRAAGDVAWWSRSRGSPAATRIAAMSVKATRTMVASTSTTTSSSGDDAAPAHPGCACTVIPEVESSTDDEEATMPEAMKSKLFLRITKVDAVKREVSAR